MRGSMESDDNLFNATMVGENPVAAFLIEGNRLHAVEPHVASLKKDKMNPTQTLILLRDALKALIKFADDKLPHEYAEMISLKPKEYDQLMEKIRHIYNHLPHQYRNELSSLIHHKQTSKRR